MVGGVAVGPGRRARARCERRAVRFRRPRRSRAGSASCCTAPRGLLMPAGAPRRRDAAASSADPVSTIAFGEVVLGGLLARARDRVVAGRPDRVAARGGDGRARVAGDARRVRCDSGRAAAMAGARATSLRTRPTRSPCCSERRRGALARIIAGGVCVAVGVTVFVVSVDSWRALRGAIVASFAVVDRRSRSSSVRACSRLAHALVDERRERIRADERAEMAAHLHDSVLQTLALGAAAGRRSARGRAPRPDAGARAARLAAAAAKHRRRRAGRVARRARSRSSRPRSRPSTACRSRSCACATARVDGHGAAAARGARGDRQRGPALRRGLGRGVPRGRARPGHDLRARPRAGLRRTEVPDDRGGITNSIVGRMQRAGGTGVVRSDAG